MKTPPIALLTDFGTRDYFVGSMKGVILSINPGAVIIDITHEVTPQNIGEAAYTLRACYRDFSVGTIFVAVVDPGVGSERRAILVETEGQYFISPDNGLLSFVLDKNSRIYEITESRFFRAPVSKTFHGRDIFAPVSAHLSLGVAANAFGDEIFDPITIEEEAPRVFEGGVEGEVIHIDRFGNLITNIESGTLPGAFTVEINGVKIDKKVDFYAEAREGEAFAIAGSAGYLEISLRDGSAEKALGIEIGQTILVMDKNAKTV